MNDLYQTQVEKSKKMVEKLFVHYLFDFCVSISYIVITMKKEKP